MQSILKCCRFVAPPPVVLPGTRSTTPGKKGRAASRRRSVTRLAAAISLARENGIPILVFSIYEPGAFARVLAGQGKFTLVSDK